MSQTSCLYSLISLWSFLLLLSAQEPCTNNGDIRLVGGSTSQRFEGRVEVCLRNVWGTVCDDSFRRSHLQVENNTKNFRTVVCRQLGLVSDESGKYEACLGHSKLIYCFPFHRPQKSMREGGLLFIIHYPATTMTSMFRMTEMCAKSLILPWL